MGQWGNQQLPVFGDCLSATTWTHPLINIHLLHISWQVNRGKGLIVDWLYGFLWEEATFKATEVKINTNQWNGQPKDFYMWWIQSTTSQPCSELSVIFKACREVFNSQRLLVKWKEPCWLTAVLLSMQKTVPNITIVVIFLFWTPRQRPFKVVIDFGKVMVGGNKYPSIHSCLVGASEIYRGQESKLCCPHIFSKDSKRHYQTSFRGDC